ncbi:hypothetical protein F4604DRAFT_1674570 [Suillus subluteus]|nr:hypothetical protein F4604DRAFT_1674570 [Suillus subluteus]
MPPPSTQVPAGYYDDTMPPPSTQVPPGHWTTAAQEVIKPHGQYHNTDLPVPANSKWVKAFLSTAVLWAGSQPNPWEMSESVMVDTLQDIFDVVYPGIKYKVNPNSAVFAVTQQWLSEWRSNIGSAALAIIVDFCSCIKDTPNAEVAKQLLKKYAFIYEDLDSILREMAYLSAFILQLMATNHLIVIANHIDVPALNTDELSLEGMDGAIVLCVVALERALKFVRDNIIKVEEVLASMATGKFAVKLPMVLNKATGKMLSGCYKFSFANCHEETELYMKSISSRSNESKAAIIAHLRKLMKKSPMKAECSDDDDEESIDECALICNKHSISLPTPYATNFPAAFVLLVPIMYSLICNFYRVI